MNEQTRSVRGSLLFAVLFLALSVFLVSQLGEQAKFSSKGKLFAQPAFWPGVGVVGMAFFSCLNLFATLIATRRSKAFDQREQSQQGQSQQEQSQQEQSKQKQTQQEHAQQLQPHDNRNEPIVGAQAILKSELKEGASWLRALEYLAWFMLYVYLTPIIGYLAATVLFLVALTLRVGYRDRRMTIIAVAVGFAIVLIFKSFLGVKIPGGAVYESLPDSLRSFMIINF